MKSPVEIGEMHNAEPGVQAASHGGIQSAQRCQPGQEFIMSWYGMPVAKLKYGGIDFAFDYETGWMMPLESHDRQPGQCPMFLRSYLPSSMSDRNVDSEVMHAMANYFMKQERFMSNVSVVKDECQLENMGHEHLHGLLRDHTSDDGVFTGHQENITPMTRSMITSITQIAAERRLTQFSGAQTKIPMFLSENGGLQLASGLPSTHIVKYAGFGSDPAYVRGAAEWIGMSLVRAGGVNCAQFALIEMPGERGPSLNYLTERFDVPSNEEDPRMMFCEELGSALGMRPRTSDMATLNDVIKGVSEKSTSVKADLAELFKQVVSNYLLENADFHCRNMSVVKVAEPTLKRFRTVRLSPAYDVMRTREFAKLPIPLGEREPMRMEFEDDSGDVIEFVNPTLDQFKTVARAMGIDGDGAQTMMTSVALGMAQQATQMKAHLPKVFDQHPAAKTHVLEVCDVVIKNAIELMPEIEHQIVPVEPEKKRGPKI